MDDSETLDFINQYTDYFDRSYLVGNGYYEKIQKKDIK